MYNYKTHDYSTNYPFDTKVVCTIKQVGNVKYYADVRVEKVYPQNDRTFKNRVKRNPRMV